MNINFSNYFKKQELFKGLSESDLEKLLVLCKEKSFSSGSIVFTEGDAPDRYYIIIEGIVEIWKDFGTSQADILAQKTSGESFGEMALIDDLPRSATVKTINELRVLYLEKESFRQMCLSNPAIALFIMRSVSKIIRDSNTTFQNNLQIRNKKLEKAYIDLKNVQMELLRSERLSTLGKFSSTIIHDLRNPLSIIKGYTEMLCLNPAGKVEFLAEKLLLEVGRLNRMVEELLDYSRGNIRLNLSVVFMNQLFMQLSEIYKENLKNRAISIEFINNLDEPVLIDQDRVHRVFVNLIENAKKAMSQGGGEILIKADKEDDFVIITVSDNGVGMNSEVLERLFEPFYSASGSGGTGLGMFVVANVIEAHKGQIFVSSTLNVGTKITLKLPMHPYSHKKTGVF